MSVDVQALKELFKQPIPDDQNVDSAHSPSWNNGYRTAANEIRPQVLALIERLEAAERDALRYRWLRSMGPRRQHTIAHYGLDEMDRMVDEAMTKEPSSEHD